MSKIELPSFVDAKMSIGKDIFVTEPDSKVELMAKSFHLEEKWLEEYLTTNCNELDPQCIKYGKIPTGKKFLLNEKGEKAILKSHRSFDVYYVWSNELLAKVRV